MFSLSLIEHDLPMPPHLLSRPLLDAIKAELERLFLDKVIANLGLCVSVYDIRSVEGGSIHAGEGCSTYRVTRALTLFIPQAQVLECCGCVIMLYGWKIREVL